MAEVKIHIEYMEIDMICEYCGDGRMRPTATVLKEYPPKYVHMCDKCGSTGMYRVRYPYITDEIREQECN